MICAALTTCAVLALLTVGGSPPTVTDVRAVVPAQFEVYNSRGQTGGTRWIEQTSRTVQQVGMSLLKERGLAYDISASPFTIVAQVSAQDSTRRVTFRREDISVVFAGVRCVPVAWDVDEDEFDLGADDRLIILVFQGGSMSMLQQMTLVARRDGRDYKIRATLEEK